jgi:MerR family transcriptional regulator, copper efflux regulator
MRFYERAGLLPRATRSPANYRLYPYETVTRIRFIRRAQKLGFTLREIKELLELNRKKTCPEVRQLAGLKAADIETRIRSLRKMRNALLNLAEQCDATSGRPGCPILEYLENEI